MAGPEPKNDFEELISLGILPNNIWAFESKNSTYQTALNSIDSSNFKQPKLIKSSIEHFFENTPKKFDIVYIDACCSLISDQHALKCIATLFKYHRLNSPGILISNFAEIDATNPILKKEYLDIISRYFYIKRNNKFLLKETNNRIEFYDDFYSFKNSIDENFDDYYGNFITEIICDTASIVIPTLRFMNSNFVNRVLKNKPQKTKGLTVDEVNSVHNNNLLKYISSNLLLEASNFDFSGINRLKKLINEVSVNDTPIDLLSSLMELNYLRTHEDGFKEDIKNAIFFFDDPKNMYQFLDKPDKILFLDSVINQISYPMHYCSNKIERYSYIAKNTKMFTDLIVFDECRYIYDWLPAIDQIKNAFSNKSWQYTFRFALDGLVKQRINYNNEFFFKGSVINKNIKPFESKTISKRIQIEERM